MQANVYAQNVSFEDMRFQNVGGGTESVIDVTGTLFFKFKALLVTSYRWHDLLLLWGSIKKK
jgi:hypothetical protein